ncbi:MAG: RibD family protein [Candidatus Competibacter sp.]
MAGTVVGMTPPSALGPEHVWTLLLALRRHVRKSSKILVRLGVGLDADGQPTILSATDPAALVGIASAGGWLARTPLDPLGAELFDLYLAVALACRARPLTVAHLGQSLDGRIATLEGASRYVNGSENLLHLHRMRALCDAVVVGANTVECDNPRLTTRQAAGPNPARVILDPSRRLAAGHEVFQDRAAPTWLVCDEALTEGAGPGQARIIGVPRRGRSLDLRAVLDQLHTRGFFSVFVEGGGLTVSSFLEQRLLDRLQITIAPLIIGSGRPGITLPAVRDLEQGLRPRCRRYALGEDVLFECQLRD